MNHARGGPRAAWALAAAALLLSALPVVAAADPPHAPSGVRAPRQGGAVRFGGGARQVAPPEGAWRHDGDERGGDWHDQEWHGDDDRGDWDDRPWHGGLEAHADWDGWHWGEGDPDDWGWRGEDWDGGYWDGRFWPRVYYDWDYPSFLAVVPSGAVTIWFGGVPYYYLNQVYYVWSPAYDGYVVADPPPALQASGTRPAPAQTSSAENSRGALSLYVYPKKGQTTQQTDNDRYQCHEWAVGQTGYDPTNTANDTHASMATPGNYERAITACLEARGYSVR